jgi:hypothetical protein
MQRDGELQARENENIHITTGEPVADRTIFIAFLLGTLALTLTLHLTLIS